MKLTLEEKSTLEFTTSKDSYYEVYLVFNNITNNLIYIGSGKKDRYKHSLKSSHSHPELIKLDNSHKDVYILFKTQNRNIARDIENTLIHDNTGKELINKYAVVKKLTYPKNELLYDKISSYLTKNFNPENYTNLAENVLASKTHTVEIKDKTIIYTVVYPEDRAVHSKIGNPHKETLKALYYNGDLTKKDFLEKFKPFGEAIFTKSISEKAINMEKNLTAEDLILLARDKSTPCRLSKKDWLTLFLYQRENGLNNSQLARKMNYSASNMSLKWKQIKKLYPQYFVESVNTEDKVLQDFLTIQYDTEEKIKSMEEELQNLRQSQDKYKRIIEMLQEDA